MKPDSKTVLKLAWILASLGCFFIPMLVIPVDDWHGWLRHVGREMGFGMLILSFPLGVFYLLAVVNFADIVLPYQPLVSSYVLMWFGFFVTGYLQWFHALPYLLDKQYSLANPSLTTLGLENARRVGRKELSHRSTGACNQSGTSMQLETRKVIEFNDIHRTPLERVIGDN